ncbi:MAG: hypothetical protein OXG35_26825 [Acidobacteria bacterium]|nr:hypothetical protein [Acidobacteriota bacterium]
MPTCTGAMRGRELRPTPKWAALLAAVLAVGGGEAAAQLTADSSFDANGLKVDVAERVTEGTSTTIAVTLKASVAANTVTATSVTVTVSAESDGFEDVTNEDADVSLNPGTATLSFPANTTTSAVTRQVSGSIVLETNHDPDAEDETVVLAIKASGGSVSIEAGSHSGGEPRRKVIVDDDEVQSYVLAPAPGAAPREGRAFDVVVSADPVHVDDSKTLTLQIDDTGYALDTDANMTGAQISGKLSGSATSFTAKVTPPTNDGNRVDDRVTVKAYSGTVGNATEEASRTFTVADAHALPAAAAVTVEVRDTAGRPVTSVAEGGAVDLTVSVDRGRGNTATTGEALSVALALAPADPAQASTYRVAPTRVDLPAVTTPGKQSAATVVRLEALADEFVNDDQLTLNLVTTGEAAYGAGSITSSFAIAVEDTTVKKVSAKSAAAVKQAFDAARTAAAGTDGLNPGEAFSVAMSDLFEGIAAGSTVVHSASSSDPSVEVSASSTAVTVTAVSAGSATVRVDARVTGSSSVSSAVAQTRSNEAAVEQVVTVAELPLRVALTADPPAAVEEGGQITLTASANRAVAAGEDATVRLTVVGPVVSPPSSVTIAVGATTDAAVLTVQDDDEVKDLGSITVVATGGSLATDPTRLDLAVTEDDAETTYRYTFTAAAARVTEGGAVTLAVTATPAVEEETVVALTAFPVSLAADYTIEPASITVAAGTTSGTAELRATDDEEVEDTETLTVTATGPGKVLIGTVEIMLVDNDAPSVVAKSQAEVDKAFADAVAAAAGPDGWTAGDRAAVIDARNLFTVAEGAAVTYAALSSNPAVVTVATSATTVTLEPVAAGAATITVTATDSASGAIATVSSGVTVSAAVVTYTLSGPADPNLVEGRSYELKVTASAAATTDAAFTLRRDRAASDAGDDDFTLEPASIVITAGAIEGTAVLTVADDGVDEGSEALVLFAVTAARDEVGSLTFTLWDAAVPALPLAAQILLAAFVAAGGYRRYRRR